MHLLLPMASSGPIIFSVICPQHTGVGPLEYASVAATGFAWAQHFSYYVPLVH
jgi:hypothetical protein